jgi:hypothetical protein
MGDADTMADMMGGGSLVENRDHIQRWDRGIANKNKPTPTKLDSNDEVILLDVLFE